MRLKIEINNPVIEKFNFKRVFGIINGPFMVFILLSFVLFMLTDILKLNNDSGRWIFLSNTNILNVANQITMNAIIAFGMTFVLLTLGIDLSVGAIVSAAGVFLSILFVDYKLPFLVSIIIVLICGMFIGFFNGVIIAKLRIPPFVVTLATMTVFRGAALLMVNGTAKFISDPTFKIIGNSYVGPIPLPVIIMILVFIVFHLVLTRTKFGRYMYIMGGNEETAVLSGIKVDKMKIWIYMIAGMAASLSGIILASRLGSGSPNVGVGYELDAITATIVGGTSLSGGVGTIVGTMAGALIIGVINNGVNILGISPYMQWVVKGAVILIAVIVDRKSHSK